MKITVIGASHTMALRHALPPDDPTIRVIGLSNTHKNVEQLSGRPWCDGRNIISPRWKDVLARDSHFVSMMRGNYHNVIGLIEHPRRFDIVDEAGRMRPLDGPPRQVVPRDAMRAMFALHAEVAMFSTRQFAALFDGTTIFISSPPPIRSAEHIRSHPSAFKRIIHRGVVPARIRKKLYDLWIETLSAACAEAGIALLPPPPEALDERGFLSEAFWGDATHANAGYGALLRRQIEEHLNR